MKKQKEVVKEPIGFGDFLVVNHDKLDRVVNGVIGPKGQAVGGIGKGADPKLILAEYDKLGGLITDKSGNKIATGTFYDFENHQPRTDIQVTMAKKNEGGAKITTLEVGDDEKPKRKGRKQVIDEAEDEV